MLLIVVIFLSTMYGIWYGFLGSNKATGTYTTPTIIVASSGSAQIACNIYKSRRLCYALRKNK